MSKLSNQQKKIQQRNNRNIVATGFEDVANTEATTEDATAVSTEDSTDTNIVNEPETAPKRKRKNPFVEVKNTVAATPRKVEKKQISVYLDIKVAEAFENYGKNAGKGAKSDLINKFLKEAFEIE